ncbi:MAG: Smr/MutS family protein [Acidobacteria bacterium]|nr:Smr/MutS family protein [Acidobacteriota bacterium]
MRHPSQRCNVILGSPGSLAVLWYGGWGMVWKQDLAKLRQNFKEDPVLPAAPAPKPPASRRLEPAPALEEEDALFLESMGKAPPPGSRNPLSPKEAADPTPVVPSVPPEEAGATFRQAMEGMKGLQPLEAGRRAPQATPAPVLPPPLPSPPLSPSLVSQLLAASEETRPLDAPPPPPEALKPRGPVLIQLAAGMAIEVDGFLDLRNHTLSDARERLKERLEDALHLGWRSLHVLLGPSEALRQGFLAFLTTPGARSVTRYAQAPIPMGGAHAWILYLGSPAS